MRSAAFTFSSLKAKTQEVPSPSLVAAKLTWESAMPTSTGYEFMYPPTVATASSSRAHATITRGASETRFAFVHAAATCLLRSSSITTMNLQGCRLSAEGARRDVGFDAGHPRPHDRSGGLVDSLRSRGETVAVRGPGSLRLHDVRPDCRVPRRPRGTDAGVPRRTERRVVGPGGGVRLDAGQSTELRRGRPRSRVHRRARAPWGADLPDVADGRQAPACELDRRAPGAGAVIRPRGRRASNQSLLGARKSRPTQWARSLARLERPADNRKVASPNLAGPIRPVRSFRCTPFPAAVGPDRGR